MVVDNTKNDSKEKNLIEDAKKEIINIFKDIKDIEVITVAAKNITPPTGPLIDIQDLKKVTLNDISSYARTTIQLEGDRYTILPSDSNGQLEKELSQIHQESTEKAVQTWNNLAHVTFTGLAIAAALAKNPLPEDVLKLISQFGIINKTE